MTTISYSYQASCRADTLSTRNFCTAPGINLRPHQYKHRLKPAKPIYTNRFAQSTAKPLTKPGHSGHISNSWYSFKHTKDVYVGGCLGRSAGIPRLGGNCCGGPSVQCRGWDSLGREGCLARCRREVWKGCRLLRV